MKRSIYLDIGVNYQIDLSECIKKRWVGLVI